MSKPVLFLMLISWPAQYRAYLDGCKFHEHPSEPSTVVTYGKRRSASSADVAKPSPMQPLSPAVQIEKQRQPPREVRLRLWYAGEVQLPICWLWEAVLTEGLSATAREKLLSAATGSWVCYHESSERGPLQTDDLRPSEARRTRLLESPRSPLHLARLGNCDECYRRTSRGMTWAVSNGLSTPGFFFCFRCVLHIDTPPLFQFGVLDRSLERAFPLPRRRHSPVSVLRCPYSCFFAYFPLV